MMPTDVEQVVERHPVRQLVDDRRRPMRRLEQRRAIVAGNARMDDAKMTGMTPPVFTFSGMCVLDPPYMPAADDALGVLHRDPPVAALDEDDRADRRRPSSTIRNRIRIRPIWPVCIWSSVCSDAAREVRRRCPRRSSSDMPLPMPRSVICSPSHMTNIVPVVSVRTSSAGSPSPGLNTSGSPPAMSRRALEQDRDSRATARRRAPSSGSACAA